MDERLREFLESVRESVAHPSPYKRNAEVLAAFERLRMRASNEDIENMIREAVK